ncbi:MAG: DUF2892 domain-containing protein [Kouleothrix sp.]|nr:DUF2892 domain-containing protein [Kouleothrix sp.]
MFTTNESTLDRAIRAVAGLVLLALVFTALSGILQIVAAVAGLILLATSAIGFCPLYALFGFSTCARQPAARR